MRRDSCTVCKLPVFLAEKLVVAHLIYHRTCFRCARCNNQLTHGNYYETETDEFCCEACPDEEVSSSDIRKYNSTPTIITTLGETKGNEIISDSSDQESASSNLKEKDHNILSHNTIEESQSEDPVIPKLVAETSRLRLNFISNHLLSTENDEIVLNDDSTDGDSNFCETHTANFHTAAANELDAKVLVNDEFVIKKGIGKSTNFVDTSLESESRNLEEDTLTQHARSSTITNFTSNILNCIMEKDVPKLTFSSISTIDNDKFNNLVTKTNNTKKQLDNTNVYESTESRLSLVQERLKLFENDYKKDHIDRSENITQNIEVETCKMESNRHTEPSSKDQIDLTLNLEAEKELKLLDDGIKTSKHNTIEGNDIPEDVGNPNIKESEKNVIFTSVTALVSPTKSSKNLEEINVDRGSNDSQTVNDAIAQSKQSYETNSINKDYPEDLNPFKSDDEDVDDHPTSIKILRSSTDLSNPFKNETIVKKEVTPPKPAKRTNISDTSKQQTTIDIQTKRRLPAPQINLNPFWSDEDDHDSDLEFQEKTPEHVSIPKPHTIDRSLNASSASLKSSEFGATPGVTPRKKQPAPLPPNNKDLHAEYLTSLSSNLQNTSAEYNKPHQRTTLKARKSKPAPPPPIATSTPYNTTMITPMTLEESPINEACNITGNQNLWEAKKMNKDEANRTKQSLTHISYADNPDYQSPYTDKSTQGKWKRKKNPAPLCPIPHRRKIEVMSLEDVKMELDEIELQQQGLEKQGVRLEQLIRNKCETGTNTNDVSMRSDVEELVLELFALVNEKNELFRRQAELMLLRRQQRLEEEHVEVEYKIRCLMSQSESTKTDYDKQREEALIQRLVQIVERRNEIIECLEMDRRREIEEDKSIHKHMGLFAAKTKSEAPDNDMNLPCCSKMKKDKSKKKTKEMKSKKMSKKDVDKDIDEAEINHKRYNKKKWF